MAEESNVKMEARGVSAYYADVRALCGIDLPIYRNEVLAITGPGGSGKTTLLRTLNRLNDLVPISRLEGQVLLDGEDVYAPSVDPCTIRRRVAMVFALPTPLPKTIYENIAYGPRVAGKRNKSQLYEIVERALHDAILWDEVKDRLHEPAMKLSGGQQQRLCIARALAQDPEVLLLDEPCSGLDPISTLKIEEALMMLKARYAVVLVSHNTQQAARASDRTAFLLTSELVEHDLTERIFTRPKDQRTGDYIEGRFG